MRGSLVMHQMARTHSFSLHLFLFLLRSFVNYENESAVLARAGKGRSEDRALTSITCLKLALRHIHRSIAEIVSRHVKQMKQTIFTFCMYIVGASGSEGDRIKWCECCRLCPEVGGGGGGGICQPFQQMRLCLRKPGILTFF